MVRYFIKRLAGAVPTLLIIITAAFFLIRGAPGGPFDQEQTLPPEILANLQAETLVVQGTAVDATHYHFSASFVVKIDAALEKAEGMGYLVHDVFNELIEVEN